MRPQILILVVCGLLGCAQVVQGGEAGAEMSQSMRPIEQALEDNRDAIMALPNVVGTGLSRCDGELCIQVLVSKDCAELKEQLDEILGQYLYVVELTDPVQALPSVD